MLVLLLDWEPIYFKKFEDAMLKQLGRYLTFDELAKMSDPQAMIVNCSVNGVHQCELEYYFDYKYYNCYRIKTNFASTQKKLTISAVLYTGRPLRISPQRGFQLFVEESRQYPLLSSPVLLSTGFGKHIRVSRNVYEQYESPYSDCTVREDNSLVRDLADRSVFDMLVTQTNYSYSRDLCLAACTQLVNNISCGCQAYDNYVLEGVKMCTAGLFVDIFTCTRNMSIVDYCIPRCPLECKKSTYKKSIYTYTYPTDYFQKYQSQFENSSDFLNNQLLDNMDNFTYDTLVEFSLEYDGSSFLQYTEEPKMSGEELLGILGGHLHLFLGMSLLSFIELAELLVWIVLKPFLANHKKSSHIKFFLSFISSLKMLI